MIYTRFTAFDVDSNPHGPCHHLVKPEPHQLAEAVVRNVKALALAGLLQYVQWQVQGFGNLLRAEKRVGLGLTPLGSEIGIDHRHRGHATRVRQLNA